MRLLRFVITSLAVIASLIGALALVMIGFIVFVFLRLFGRKAAMPRFQRSVSRTPTRPAYSSKDEVIDIESTPVKER